MTKIAVFASGTGSNAAKIIDYFRHHPSIRVELVVCNRPGAGVTAVAADRNLPVLLIEKEEFFRGSGYLPELQEKEIGFIVLAGFLWKIPRLLIDAYPGAIVNIHPALLPLHGGKGMYGMRVHEDVIKSGENQSGITIHWVDEQYDNGAIIFQERCPVDASDTPESLAQKIHELEHRHFPAVIEKLITARTEKEFPEIRR